jgi:hypothetical protein
LFSPIRRCLRPAWKPGDLEARKPGREEGEKRRGGENATRLRSLSYAAASMPKWENRAPVVAEKDVERS